MKQGRQGMEREDWQGNRYESKKKPGVNCDENREERRLKKYEEMCCKNIRSRKTRAG